MNNKFKQEKIISHDETFELKDSKNSAKSDAWSRFFIYYDIHKNAVFEMVVATEVISSSYRKRDVSFHMLRKLTIKFQVNFPSSSIAQMQISIYIFHI